MSCSVLFITLQAVCSW